MFTTIIAGVTEAGAISYDVIDSNGLAYEREFNAWLDELEEKAAYCELVLRYGGNEAFRIDGF
jgi:hypothetical protein